MTSSLPSAPEFGAPLPVGERNADVLAFLALRRSASAASLTAPGPSADEVDDLIRLAARVPDHGKLFPWRFVVLEGADKAAFAAALEAIAGKAADPDKRLAALAKLRNPPLSIAVVSRLTEGKIPAWEQELSAGAVCLTLLLAAQAAGYGANWITDWYAYDDEARALLGLAAHERVAGFVHIGRASEAPLERVRPELSAITTRWRAPAAQDLA